MTPLTQQLKDKKIVEFVEKNFAGLDPRDNTFWGYDTNIGTKDEIIKVVKDFILEQAIAEINEKDKEIFGLGNALKDYEEQSRQGNKINKELQKQRQEILDRNLEIADMLDDMFINFSTMDYSKKGDTWTILKQDWNKCIKELKQQLNQPKTAHTGVSSEEQKQ